MRMCNRPHRNRSQVSGFPEVQQQFPATPSAVTPIRRSTDRTAAAVSEFCERHPEYARLGVDVVEQAMATYLTEDEHRVRKLLADEGVPVGRRAGRWSDDV